jgi:hypothetical protein
LDGKGGEFGGYTTTIKITLFNFAHKIQKNGKSSAQKLRSVDPVTVSNYNKCTMGKKIGNPLSCHPAVIWDGQFL